MLHSWYTAQIFPPNHILLQRQTTPMKEIIMCCFYIANFTTFQAVLILWHGAVTPGEIKKGPFNEQRIWFWNENFENCLNLVAVNHEAPTTKSFCVVVAGKAGKCEEQIRMVILQLREKLEQIKERALREEVEQHIWK